MTKKMFFKMLVFLAIINILFSTNIWAINEGEIKKLSVKESDTFESILISENNNDNVKENTEKNDKEIKQIEELNSIIKELVKSLKSKVKTIDEKIEEIREIKEYEKYPAIRLNIDTPIFGLASVTNSKLKIKQDIAGVDIAKGYSIRYIIKNNSIKLPNKYVAGILVSTKDVKFDENISLVDANAAVIKLMQYSKTADNVIEFLNNQTSKIFKGYIEATKKESISEVNRKLTKLNNDLIRSDEKLLTLKIVLVSAEDKESYNKQLEKFNQISKKIKENEKKIKNILISDESLLKVQKSVIELESEMLDFSVEVNNSLEDKTKNINEKEMLLNVQKEILKRRSNLEEIVNNSTVKKVIKNKVDEKENKESKNVEENEDANIKNNAENMSEKEDKDEKTETKSEDSKMSKDIAIEEIEIYEVVSKNILKEIDEKIIKNIENKVEEYVKKENTSEEKESKADKKDENSAEKDENKKENVESENKQENVLENGKKETTKEITEDEKKELLNEVILLYKSYISKENQFYLENLNYTLEKTTSKISDLSKYTNSNILSEMRYIYLELPTAIEKYLDSTNMNSCSETKSLSNNFNEELDKLLKVYVKLDEIYEKLNVKNIKENA